METTLPRPKTATQSWLWLTAAAAVWAGLYALNEHVWTWAFTAAGLDLEQRIPGAVRFFLYDSCKVLLLLVGMIFVIGLLRTTLRPETVRNYLLDKPLWIQLLLAVLLGAITPFCSCSSVPLFIGFVAAGIPLSVTLAFLIASPLVNEVAVVMLGQSFGLAITVTYVAAGLGVAMILGAILSRFDFEDQVQAFVRTTPAVKLQMENEKPTLAQRIDAALGEVSEIVGRVWKWVLIGVGVGAFIHGWIPAEVLSRWAGADNPFAVLIVVLLGIPLYSNAAGVIPIAEALWAKGMATGTVLSFTMATVALSFPEFVLLKQVIKSKLIAIFFGSVGLAIIVVGFGLNLIFH